ncbi:hypothetical protein [Actinokineospora sp. NBRC 105648]|uniref:hypothetical protein n=1 Tax=Actinokineospora sp. NBRC 105648 TaxID=3032206 RepID=UPI0024A21AB4|nr:hypothetical protein [Actinokineospora sp. NBRC 105648]GLZ42350.1 hypothetical protein Acsp05_59740 [Actinokineospora sp. NBRC 105648]
MTSKRSTTLAALLLAAALGFAAWAGAGYLGRGTDQGATRDEVLATARQAVATFNTLDYRQADQGLDRWLASSTGTLHDELTRTRDSSRQRIEAAKTVTEGRVVDAAVTELDTARGTAEVLAAVETVVVPDGGQATTKRGRFQAELTRTETGWRLSALAQVPVTT